MANYIPVQSKSILTHHKYIDDWFGAKYSMNLYRGCEHACAYCDGRSEKYYVEGDFGQDVQVKINAVEVLEKELAKLKEKSPICVSGGVGDPYQPAEERFNLTRNVLLLLEKMNYPGYILTKSSLVERDIEIIQQINSRKRCVVCFSISTVDEKIAEILERGASAPGERLASLKLFKEAGIPTGVWFVPVIPFISDQAASMEKVIRAVKEVGAEFILIGGMTLKQGKQNEHFMAVLKSNFPELVEKYETLYSTETKWGEVSGKYYEEVFKMAYALCKKYSLPTRIPWELFCGTMEIKCEAAMILAHIGYFLEQEGTKRDAYKWAARNIQEVEDIVELCRQGKLTQIPAVGEKIAGMIGEIINTGRCGYYEKLRKGCDAPDHRLPITDYRLPITNHRSPITDHRQLKLYTDGACKGNPGPGGWAAILISDGREQKFSGAEPLTTNNRMELMAIIQGLKAIKQPGQVRIYSDSAYVVNAFKQHWVKKWRANGWLTADKQPVKNQELWQELIRLTQPHQVDWVKVKGHAGNKYNERCDQMAVSACTSVKARQAGG